MNTLATEPRWPENLFVLRRQHWMYLTGATHNLEPSRLSPTERTLLALLCTLTLFIAGVALYLSATSLRLTEQGQTIRAAVVEHGARPNLPGIGYYVRYAFTVDGQNYAAEQAITRTIYQRLSRRGATAEVAYLPDNPAISRLAGANQIYTETSLAIFGVFAGLGAMAAVFIRPYRTRRLARDGHIILGEIKTQRQDGANIHLRFTFLSPQGRRLDGIGSTTIQENDIQPAPGVPVAVLYLNENFYRMI